MPRRLAGAARLVLVALLLQPLAGAQAADWSRWLGPRQDGSSPERDVFSGAPRLSVSWKRPLGVAYSGIAVAGGRAVTMFGDGESDFVVALDAGSGEEVWRFRIGEMFPKVGGADGGQLSTPVIDEGTVFVLGARGTLYALKLDDGAERWSLALGEELGAKQPYFGFTTTPLVSGKTVFVQAGGADGKSLVALDKETGKLLWSAGDEPVGYQSPVLSKLAGREQIVAATNLAVSGRDPATGKLLWRVEHGLAERDGWSTPIALGDDRFLLTARNESAAYRVAAQGDGFAVEELWRGGNLKGNFAMPVVYEGFVYGYNGDFLACVEAASGEERWKTRSDAAGLVLVDGHLVILASDGNVVVAAASPEAYEEKARIAATAGGGFTFPSFSDGAVFVRDLRTIARVAVD
jgi:outer membrane protein assembly factor BamB